MIRIRPAHTAQELEQLFSQRIAVLDGAMGSMIQTYPLTEADFRGEQLREHPKDLKGNNDLLCLTRPDIIEEIHMLMPNKHNLLVDLSRFGRDNPNHIFVPTDEPHGTIEATVQRA